MTATPPMGGGNWLRIMGIVYLVRLARERRRRRRANRR